MSIFMLDHAFDFFSLRDHDFRLEDAFMVVGVFFNNTEELGCTRHGLLMNWRFQLSEMMHRYGSPLKRYFR